MYTWLIDEYVTLEYLKKRNISRLYFLSQAQDKAHNCCSTPITQNTSFAMQYNTIHYSQAPCIRSAALPLYKRL